MVQVHSSLSLFNKCHTSNDYIIAYIVLAHYINAYAAVYTFGFWLINSSMRWTLFIPKVSANLPHLPIAVSRLA